MKYLKRGFKWLIKTTLTVMIVFAVFFIFGAIFISKISYDHMSDKVDVKKNSYLVLSFPNGLKESSSEQINLNLVSLKDINKRQLTFYEVLKSVEQAANDIKISGIILGLDAWNISSVQTKEISLALKKFKESGKKVYAYSTGMNKSSYLAAIYADEIIMPPSSSSNLVLAGYSISIPYYKNLGDKLGIDVNVIHIGDFKGFGENYAKSKMSNNLRESYTNLLDARLELFVQDVASSRSIDKSKFLNRLVSPANP